MQSAVDDFREETQGTLGRIGPFAERYGGYPPDELDAFLDIRDKNDTFTGKRISRYVFQLADWPDRYHDIRAMVAAIRLYSPKGAATLDRIGPRFKANFDLLKDDMKWWPSPTGNTTTFNPESDEPLDIFIDGWGTPIEYYSTRSVPCDSSDKRAALAGILVDSFNNKRPVLMSYGPDGAEQQPDAGMVQSGEAQRFVQDFADDNTINNSLNRDNVFSVPGLPEKLLNKDLCPP